MQPRARMLASENARSPKKGAGMRKKAQAGGKRHRQAEKGAGRRKKADPQRSQQQGAIISRIDDRRLKTTKKSTAVVEAAGPHGAVGEEEEEK